MAGTAEFRQHQTLLADCKSRTVRLSAKLALLMILPACGFCDVQTTSQTLSANVSPNGKISVSGSVGLLSADTHFGALGGSLTVSYWARTTVGGGGSVTVQASEFSPASGPTAGLVTYSCSGATLGTACTDVQALSTATQTPLVSLPGGACTGGGGVCTAQDSATVQLTFTLPSQPHYKTGSYSAQITFTISTM